MSRHYRAGGQDASTGGRSADDADEPQIKPSASAFYLRHLRISLFTSGSASGGKLANVWSRLAEEKEEGIIENKKQAQK
jgi:hypothetical protein